jgi:hypothetical protein
MSRKKIAVFGKVVDRIGSLWDPVRDWLSLEAFTDVSECSLLSFKIHLILHDLKLRRLVRIEQARNFGNV